VIEGTKRCNDCHQHKKWEGRVIVGEPKGYKACLKCHDSVDFGAIHFHPLQPLEACQMCHSMHGSSQKALLKAPVKKLCGVCHES
jgi:predicted CXXCH cytochrome family protein